MSQNIKPILFNTEMVQAILAGQKTQTRRVIKTPPYEVHEEIGGLIRVTKPLKTKNEYCRFVPADPPYQVGNILYVRETFTKMLNLDTGETKLYYAANTDDADIVGKTDLCDGDGFGYIPERRFPWRPSIHMPKAAARIFLRVTAVNVDRLNDITVESTAKEGITKALSLHLCDSKPLDSIETFALLWDSTIKKKDLPLYGWEANPWVWVYTFERCEKPEG